MIMRFLPAFFLLFTVVHDVRAQGCAVFALPVLSVCASANCSILIDVRPRGLARVLPDNKYGRQLGISFGERSIFDLGDSGRLNFGNGGGMQALRTDAEGTLSCTPFPPGLLPYTVDMTPGGWLDFSGNNRFELNQNNVFSLGGFSKIDGRLDIQSEGTVNMGSNGEMAMPNVDIDAAQGITLSGQGDVQIGNLQNQGAPADNQGINITADGDVTIGIVDGNGDFSVAAGGDINIAEIRNADSISLMITPPATGIIKIGGNQTAISPVICAPTDDCNGFQLDGDGGSGGDGCNTVNPDPDAPNNCGGGAAGPGFILVLMCALLWRRRIKSNRGGRTHCSPPAGRSV